MCTFIAEEKADPTSPWSTAEMCRVLAVSRSGFYTASVRRTLIVVPGRLVHSARRLHLRLPTRWPWQHELHDALTAFERIPRPG